MASSASDKNISESFIASCIQNHMGIVFLSIPQIVVIECVCFIILSRDDRGCDAGLWVDTNLSVSFVQLLSLQTLFVTKLHAIGRKVR